MKLTNFFLAAAMATAMGCADSAYDESSTQSAIIGQSGSVSWSLIPRADDLYDVTIDTEHGAFVGLTNLTRHNLTFVPLLEDLPEPGEPEESWHFGKPDTFKAPIVIRTPSSHEGARDAATAALKRGALDYPPEVGDIVDDVTRGGISAGASHQPPRVGGLAN